uniref:Tyrosine-protein phosphatase non-receptor type n=1 Tax=Takifugu rubripes TaxID=31033 RepID=A0A674N3X7_TAKRU
MPLPFGLKLKRTRRYTVSSKSCLVTRIQLLNGEFVEFTLSVESTGQECLEAVAQRLELREITYFSLWYFNKQNQQRWIDLEKPLKKQLDKYGLEPTVYFGVVFYVPSVVQLQQEITRYQYYLQLKKDVLEGRISCSLEQAIRLASLAVQADFGDFNRYDSQDFLQKFVLFPIVSLSYSNFNLTFAFLSSSLALAEMLYMQEVEKMEGYGQESFQAKVNLWNEINNMSHNRSFFAVELTNREESVQFQTEDMETSKYVCRMCLARLKFYRINKSTYMMPPPQLHYNGHFTEPYTSSQDNLYMNNQNGYYYHSQTSLDCTPLEYGTGGRLRNGSVYSAHSTSSLTNPQHYLQPSPMSSNPSITSDITRPDYVPSHRHSALIPPSYRATPDYETVMRQKARGPGGGMVLSQDHRQSHSMRNLNIGNSYAYSRPDPLVYSQPEIRGEHGGTTQRHHYPFHLGSSFHSPSPYPYPTERRPVVGAVSVPELTNVQLQQAQEYPAPNIMRTQVYRPPPPYPYAHPRPANSTPDLSRHLYVSSSNPDLVITRRVHHSVQTFQEDSLPVAHSLQEVSEPLFSGAPQRHLYNAQKRNSIEIAGLEYSLEGMRLKERTVSSSAAESATPPPVLHGGRSQGSQLNVFLEHPKKEEIKESVQYGHKKSLSDATMLVHSSGEEEELEDEGGRHTPLTQEAAAALGPNQPSQPHRSLTPLTALAPQQQNQMEPPPAYPIGSSLDPSITSSITYKVHPMIQGEPLYLLPDLRQPRIIPSISDGDLSGQAKQKTKKDVKKRPVSELPPGKKTVEGLPPPKGPRSEAKKMGPLKMAHLNGLSVSRQPMYSDTKDEPERASNDERCKLLEQHMERGELLKEYESIPRRHPAGECYIAQQPESSDKNRFHDVLPYDSSRVELVPTKENNTGYINASHVKLTAGGQEWNYIASQGPLSNTCQDFWQMVWEQGVSIIAMVTAEEERGREKSFRYWPRLGSRHNTVTYGRFKITTRFRTESGCYATTGLKIKHLLTGQERTIWHLQYTDWPDHGCPDDIKGFLTYLEEIQSVRRHTNSISDPKNTNLPVLVHCSAGVGRTGVVILSEILIACLEHNETLDIPNVLLKLRAQRMMVVQTFAQYSFIYKVLIHYLRNSRLI